MPLLAERESAEETANLCLRLFSALGVKEVSIMDIDTAHRVLARKASPKPNAIVCKFTRRLARKKVSTLQPGQIGFSEGISLKDLAIYDHLSSRLQSLLYEAKKFKQSNGFLFVGREMVSSSSESQSSKTVKLSCLEDLNALAVMK